MKKEDLNKPATKGDLWAFATKKDLRAFATKKDLGDFRIELKEELKKCATKEDLHEFAKKVVTKEEFNYRIDDLEIRMDQMVNRDDWNEYMKFMDELMTEVRASREERILFEKQWLRASDTLHDHEKRILVLEKAA